MTYTEAIVMTTAEFMAEKKWGVFTHYLYGEICRAGDPHNRGTGITDWNTAVNMFDVERMAYTLHKMNAGYYFITLQQSSAHLLAPNATFDKIAGTKPGEACAKRDLPMELAVELEKYGIDLCLYFTGDGPSGHKEISKKFDCFTTDEHQRDADEAFCEKWAAVAGEYAERYGKRVKAWWIDGCYKDRWNYTDELLSIYHKAIKKGNPDAACAFNDGVKDGFWKGYRDEEFICGEFNEFRLIPYNKYIEGAQAHVLAPLGYYENSMEIPGWAQKGLTHTKEYMRDYIRNVSRVGGAVSVDMFVDIGGSLDPEQEYVMRWVGENL